MTGVSNGTTGGGRSRRAVLAAAAAVTAAPLALPGGAADAAPGAPRVLRYTDHAPLGGMRTAFLRDVVFPAVERESRGRLRIEAHWNGELAGSFDALRAVGEGVVADLGTVVGEYTAQRTPLHQIFKSFPLGPSGSRQVEFLRRVYADVPAVPAELARNNVVPVFLGTGYPTAFYSAAPLAGLAGLRGGTWRTSSFWHRDYLINSGATPVSTAWGPGTLDDLRSGVLDGVMVNADDGYLISVQEAAPHVLISKELWMGHVYPVTMNKAVWDGLSPADRAAVRRAAAHAYRTLGPVMDAAFDAQVDALRAAGARVRILGPGELERWQSVTRYRDVQAAWVAERTAEGVTEAGPALRRISRIMDRFPPTG